MDVVNSAPPSLSVRGLTKTYHTQRSLLSRKRIEVHAVRGVDLELPAGNTLAIVGASGSGKSTVARCIAGLLQPTSGEIWLAGRSLVSEGAAHRHVQFVFQDPGASLNPRFTVADALLEPLMAVRSSSRLSRFSVAEALQQAGLPATVATRLTSQLSGGQKARLAVARALAALDASGPAILILDESLSSMDLSVRAQMINLLVDLQERRGLTYILITHDASLAAHMADEIAVMAEGVIVKRGPHV